MAFLAWIVGVLGAVTTRVLLPLVIDLVRRAGFVRKNYQGRVIPTGGGLVFVFTVVTTLWVFIPFSPQGKGAEIVTLLYLVSGLGFVGLVDDWLDLEAAKGFTGHLRLLRRGRLSTGAIKAFGGGVIALGVSLAQFSGFVEVMTNTLLVALTANFINLLDLRPGRAVKGFLVGSVLLVLTGFWTGLDRVYLLAPLVGASLAYLPWDLRERLILGDVGSNVLGGSLGLALAWQLSLPVRMVLVFLLFCLHLWCENHSLTGLIRNNVLLNYLDRLGRTRT